MAIWSYTFSYMKLYSTFSDIKYFSASGEAILGTQRYLHVRFLIYFVRASGEAILGTLKYVSEGFVMFFFDCPPPRKIFCRLTFDDFL